VLGALWLDTDDEPPNWSGGGAVLGIVGAPVPWLLNVIPDGCLEFNGQAITAAAYPKLYGLFGANLPDLRGLTLLGASASHPIGSTGGTETETLSVAQIPSHNHGGSTGTGVTGTGTSGTQAATATGTESADHTHSGSTGAAGSHSHDTADGTGYFMTNDSSTITVGSGGTARYYGQKLQLTNAVPAHTHTLTTGGRSAAHTHTVPAHSHTVPSLSIPALSIPAQGGGGSHNNLPPFRAVRWITVAG
jgi:microcystin-dependent protein